MNNSIHNSFSFIWWLESKGGGVILPPNLGANLGSFWLDFHMKTIDFASTHFFSGEFRFGSTLACIWVRFGSTFISRLRFLDHLGCVFKNEQGYETRPKSNPNRTQMWPKSDPNDNWVRFGFVLGCFWVHFHSDEQAGRRAPLASAFGSREASDIGEGIPLGFFLWRQRDTMGHTGAPSGGGLHKVESASGPSLSPPIGLSS